MTADVTIRFSQVDAAGIVFYPRYFEMLSRNFTDVPWANGPVAMQTDFLRPNRLGDRVTIREEHDEKGWSYTGSMDGKDHFRVVSSSTWDGQQNIAVDAQQSFVSEPEIIRTWAIDGSGRMQLSRYFEFVSDTVEQWVEAVLGLTFHDLHIVRKLGVPTVRFVTRIAELPRLGDKVTLHMQALKVGEKSLTLRSWLMCGTDCLVENDQVLVFVAMRERGFQSISIPGEFRARLQEQ